MDDLNQVKTTVNELKTSITNKVRTIDHTLDIHKLVKANRGTFGITNDNQFTQIDLVTDTIIDQVYNKIKNEVLESIKESSVSVEIK